MYDLQRTLSASSVAEALTLLGENPGAVVVNGGTDVMLRLKQRKLTEAVLISIMPIAALRTITLRDNGDIAIGAGACFRDIHEDPLIRTHLPALSYAAAQVGSPQIRHVATIGGNLCNGAVSADSVPALLSYNALLEIASPDGIRTLPLAQFHTGPGRTVLDKSRELLTAIVVPKADYAGYSAAYLKFGQRNAMEIATLGCAVCLCLTPDRTALRDIRIAFSVAAPTPLRCEETEQALRGMALNTETVKALRRGVASEVQPRDSWRASKKFRLQLARELSERAFEEAVEKAGGKLQ